MKTFKKLLSEVAQPKAGDEKEFKKKHKIEVIDEPNAEEVQFSGGTKKTPPRRADYTGRKDEDVYEEAEIYEAKESSDIILGHFKQAPHLKLKVMKHGRDPVLKKPRHSIFIHDEKTGKKQLIMTSVKPETSISQHRDNLTRSVGSKINAAGGVKWHDEKTESEIIFNPETGLYEDVDQLDEISVKLTRDAAFIAGQKANRSASDIWDAQDKMRKMNDSDREKESHNLVRHIMTRTKRTKQKEKFLNYASDKAQKNEDVDTLHEVFSAGTVKMSDGSKLTVTSEDASILNTLYKNLGGSSQSAMYNHALSNKKNFGELLSFAKTTVGDK